MNAFRKYNFTYTLKCIFSVPRDSPTWWPTRWSPHPSRSTSKVVGSWWVTGNGRGGFLILLCLQESLWRTNTLYFCSSLFTSLENVFTFCHVLIFLSSNPSLLLLLSVLVFPNRKLGETSPSLICHQVLTSLLTKNLIPSPHLAFGSSKANQSLLVSHMD